MANERLISLGEAMRMIKNSREDCPVTSISGRFLWTQAHDCALSCLTACHTVDAVEVVHGRCKWCDGEYNTKIMATAIRYHTNGDMSGYELPVNHCPNCGAKMDGDGNG